MDVVIKKQYGSRKVGDIVPDMPDTTAKDLIKKGFVEENNKCTNVKNTKKNEKNS